jgi:hypothetical protein
MYRPTNLFFLLLLLLPHAGRTQVALLLEKNGIAVCNFSPGSELDWQTADGIWHWGTLSDVRKDSLFLSGRLVRFGEIAAIMAEHRNFVNSTLSKGFLLTGLMAIDIVLTDQDASSLLGPGLVGGACCLTAALITALVGKYKTYKIGKKYSLQFIRC